MGDRNVPRLNGDYRQAHHKHSGKHTLKRGAFLRVNYTSLKLILKNITQEPITQCEMSCINALPSLPALHVVAASLILIKHL